MAYQCFVEFDSPISNYCEAISYSFGYQGSPAAGGARSQASVNGLNFTKGRDSLSPQLMQYCATGTRFATVWVEIYRDDENDPYLTYELSDATINSFQLNGERDAVGLNYKTMKYSY